MNKQGKTGKDSGIGWTKVWGRPGYTWNPTRGCHHGCTWRMPDGTVIECYAKGVAERLAKDAYPLGFEAHYWAGDDVITQPVGLSKPAGIFVGSMADLFGHWVPQHQQYKVFGVMRHADQHIYLTLSKFPNRYVELYNQNSFPDNMWPGVSLPAGHLMTKTGGARALSKYLEHMKMFHARVQFMSLEPLWFDAAPVFLAHLKTYGDLPFNWVIIGAASNGPKLYQPSAYWVAKLVKLFDDQGIPVFYKSNLKANAAVKDTGYRREFPMQERVMTDTAWPEREGI